MAANVYECMFILDSTKVAGNLDNADKVLRATLEKHGAEVLVSRLWSEQKLTYPIRKQKKGIYYITYFSCDGKKLVEMENDFSLNEMVLRLLVIKIHPKLVDTMLSLAKGEHAAPLHNMQEEGSGEGAAVGAGAPAGGDGEARRPRRNEPRE